MNIIKTDFEGLYILEPIVHNDNRGFFMESFSVQTMRKLGFNFNFVQDNHSKSSFGVLRGLHFQKPPFDQTKLVRAVEGRIIDVVVDIRKSSPTFGKSFEIELSAQNKRQLLVPKGFANGFSVISETAEILYKIDNFYNKESEGGLMFNDPSFTIDWGLPKEKIILSEKDKNYLPFKDFNSEFE